jgi:hypothetical protein
MVFEQSQQLLLPCPSLGHALRISAEGDEDRIHGIGIRLGALLDFRANAREGANIRLTHGSNQALRSRWTFCSCPGSDY